MTTQHHDGLFRFTFAASEHAAGLLRVNLAAVLVTAIDWATLKPWAASKTGGNLRLHHADLLFRARLAHSLAHRDAPIFFLIEHKSGPDASTSRQLLRYVVHIASEWNRTRPMLSGIVPIVIHHGACPWPNTAWGSPPTIEGDPAVEAELQRFHPELRYLLFDLARCSEADLMVRDMTALGRLTLLSLQFLRQFSDDEALAAIDRWRDLIGAVHAAPGGHANLEAVWCYFLQVTDLTTERLADTVARVLQNPDEDSVMSTADKLIAKGRTEGRTEGRAEGRAELLLGLLRKRFGQLPGGVTTRVQQATLEDLELWAERILDARSLADVFAAE